MKTGWKRWLWLGLRVVFGGALLVLAFRQIEWASVIPVLAHTSPLWLLLGWGSILLSLALRIWRWQLLLANYQIEAGFQDVAAAYMIGQSANIIMPFRSGELFRFGWLRARYPQGGIAMAATIFIEKYLDLGMLLLFFVVVMPYLPVEVIEANLTGMLLGSAVLTVMIVVGAVSAPRIGLWLSHAIRQRFPRTAPVIDPLARWLVDSAWMQSPRRFLPLVGLSLAIWLVMSLTNVLMMRAVGLPWDVRAAVLVVVLVSAGSAPALVPGNIGPFHFFAMLALSLMGLGGEQSAAFALFLHALVNLTPLLISAGLVLTAGRARYSFFRQVGELPGEQVANDK